MSLQSFVNRFMKQDPPPADAAPIVNFGGMQDYEMDTVVSKSGVVRQPQHQRHAGFVAIIGVSPGTLLADGLLAQRNPDDTVTLGSDALRAFDLPTNSHAVMSLLYNLEYADLILYTLNIHQGLGADHLRWINRLQGRRTPLVIILNGVNRTNQKHLHSIMQMIELRINAPVVPVHTDDHEKSRQSLVEVIYRISPRLAAIMSIHSPLLRPVLAEHMLNKSIHTSMSLDGDTASDEDLSALAEEQVRLIRQIAAVYGRGTRLSRREYTGLVSMVEAVTGYSSELVSTLPAVKEERRTRLANAISTLMVGYITMIYHGETPPEIRSELLPRIWRLYRATGQMADA